MNCSPALQCISIRRFEREVLAFPRFQVAVVSMATAKPYGQAAVNAFRGVQPRLFERLALGEREVLAYP